MRHFSSDDVTSVVIRLQPSAVMQEMIAEAIVDAVEYGSWPQQREVMIPMVSAFVFDGDRDCASFLFHSGAPSEFRVIRDARRWYKKIEKQFKYRSSKFYTREGDFLYCNVNTGKCVVLIDGHSWD